MSVITELIQDVVGAKFRDGKSTVTYSELLGKVEEFLNTNVENEVIDSRLLSIFKEITSTLWIEKSDASFQTKKVRPFF